MGVKLGLSIERGKILSSVEEKVLKRKSGT
jgi:hypothetical protein